MPVPRVLLAVVLIVASGCASGRSAPAPVQPVRPAAAARVDVDALVRQGCFHCLERALAAAEGAQAFEIAALLTLRAKELGLPSGDYRRMAGELAMIDSGFSTYLDAIDAIPADVLAGEQYRPAAGGPAIRIEPGGPGAPVRLSPVAARVTEWRDALRTGPGSDLFRRYLDLATVCGLGTSGKFPEPDTTVTSETAPLLRYRIGVCGRARDEFRALRDEDPAYVDADFTLARQAVNGTPADLDEGLRWVRSAFDAFPRSTAIATALGQVYDAREEWAEALAAYDAVLAMMPEHRAARLGRTVALSRLARHDEAIASASQMIQLGSWLLGEAYYWRAWNEFSLQQYPAARVDTDRTKTLMVNASVFVLSGLVEWNRQRLPSAESEFEEALKMDFGRCDAAHYLGRVRTQRSKVPEALAAFRQAIQCFDLSITVRQKLIADIQAGPGSDATKARLAAGHQRAIDSARADRDECRQRIDALEGRSTPNGGEPGSSTSARP